MITQVDPPRALALLRETVKEVERVAPTRELAEALIASSTRAIAQAETIEDVKEIHDKLQAMETLFRRQKAELVSGNLLAAQRLQTERMIGTYLSDNLERGGNGSNQYEQKSTGSTFATLPELGISKYQSSKWQKVAEIDGEDFREWVEEGIRGKFELTTDGALDLWRELVEPEKKIEKLAHLPAAPEWDGEFALDTVSVCSIEDLELPHNSIDLIFTDPPYHDEYLSLYDHLAQLAGDCLKPGGYLMTYVGKMFLPQIHDALRAAGLEYVWEFCVYQPDNNQKINKHHLFEAWRPIVAYKKPGDTETREWQPDALRGTRNKEFHEWQQQDEPALKYIEAYTLPGQLVLDPFVGGGTTVAACKALKRHYLAFDKEEAAVKMTMARLNGQH